MLKQLSILLKKHLTNWIWGKYKEFIHFALTSQDANNTAIPKSIQDALENEYYPLLQQLIEKLLTLANEWKSIPMLAKTHGQPASPTKLGKEIKVFIERIMVQLVHLKSIAIDAKFGGANGNFNAHYVAYPEINWEEFANKLLKDNLGPKPFTVYYSNFTLRQP